MTASDFAISFPYGATSPPYSTASPHRGDDRPCPLGTPITIGNVTIGLTGATGKTTGPHLHIQEWRNGYVNTRKPQNAFRPGTVTNIDPNGTQGDGSFGKFVTIQTPDGWNDSYCHLSRIDVKVGRVIGEDMSIYDATPTDADKQTHYQKRLFRNATPAEIANHATWGQVLDDNVTELGKRLQASQNNTPGFEQITEPVFKKK